MSELRTRILSCDIASSTGFSAYDTTKPPSSIINGAFSLTVNIPKPHKGAKKITGVEKRWYMRRELMTQLNALWNRFEPKVICLEQPLNAIMGNDEEAEPGRPPKGGPNASTVLALNQLFAVADAFFIGKGAYIIETSPRTWQGLIRGYPGENTKAKSLAFCAAMKIPISAKTIVQRGDAADASVLSMWCAGECQARKNRQAQKELL